jgi:predicted RND superfamily exporter protein
MNSNLLSLYHKLLREYDKVLSLTDKLLYALQTKETEENINSLLDQRLRITQTIQEMTRSLNNFSPSDSERVEPQIIEQLKSIHSKLEEKANLLEAKEIELEKLAGELG